jgi:hypothetical protein
MKKNPMAMFMMFAMALMFIAPDIAMAAGDPVEEMKKIYLDQAETNAFPAIILWIVVLGVALSFKMNSFMPFILAVIASVVIGISPELVPNFNYTNLQAP